MTRKFEERVAGAFLANCCCGAMAGIHDCLVRQNQQLLMYRAQNLLRRTAPEVGSADAAGKKSVSREESSRFRGGVRLWLRGQIERDASRRVSWRMQDIGLKSAPAERIALAQELIDTGRIGGAHADPGGLH